MAKGEENLIPFTERTEEEQREIAKMGGIASGKARKEKATMKKTLQMLLEETYKGDLTYRESATLGLLKGAIEGKADNYKTKPETHRENNIGRHQSRYVTTRIASVNSPWLAGCKVGDEHTIAISHGEGKFVASDAVMKKLIENGQIATQYVDAFGAPSMDISANPNGSYNAVEGILSPDGRVLGKMGHTERRGQYVAKNIYGNKYQPIFENGVKYFKK